MKHRPFTLGRGCPWRALTVRWLRVDGRVGGNATQVPDVKLPINPPKQLQESSWLLTTYLDDTLRISRGDGGSIFVLTKEPEEAFW